MRKITKMKKIILTLLIVCGLVIGGKLLTNSQNVASVDPPGLKPIAYVVGTDSVDPPGL